MNAINTHLTGESVHEYGEVDAHRLLIGRILEQAFVDATYDGDVQQLRQEQKTAHRWISTCHRQFRHYCDLLGLDADFLSEAYNAGRVKREWLKSSEPARTAPGFERGDLQAVVLAALKGEMTTRQLTDELRERGCDVTINQVGNALRGTLLRRGTVERRVKNRVAVWRVTPHEPHVSCKDRIAAAKAEATK